MTWSAINNAEPKTPYWPSGSPCYDIDTPRTQRMSCQGHVEQRRETSHATITRTDARQVSRSCVHTLTCCTHIFLLHSLSAHIRTSSCVCTCTHGSSVCKNVFAYVSFLFISLSPFSCLTHLLLSPYDVSRLSRPHVLAVHTCPKSAEHAHLRTRTRSLTIWRGPPSTQVMSPTSSTRSLLWTVTRCSLTIQTSMKSLTSRKAHTRTLDCSVFSQSLNPLFRTFMMRILLFK